MRLFVAVDIPMEVKEKVADLRSELPPDNTKPVKIENMHLTLRFIGEVPEVQITEIKKKLSDIKFNKFKLSMKSVGVFPNENYPKVIWIGCENKELDKLAGKIISALSGIGKEDTGKFSAHLTIARVRRKINVKEFLQKHKNENFGEFEISEFKLIQSILDSDGPTYSVVAEFKAA